MTVSNSLFAFPSENESVVRGQALERLKCNRISRGRKSNDVLGVKVSSEQLVIMKHD